MNLEEFQQNLSKVIRGRGVSTDLENIIIPSQRMSNPAEALKIYQQAYPACMSEALGELFAACWWVMGDEDFFRICARYIEEYSSEHYSLGMYGGNFISILEEEQEALGFPFLSELGRLEYACNNVFHQRVPRPCKFREVPPLDGDAYDLSFKIKGDLFDSPYNLLAIWLQRDEDEQGLDLEHKLNPYKPQSLLIYRSSHGLSFLELSQHQYEFYRRLLAGVSLFQAVEELETEDNLLDPEKVGGDLKRLLNIGVVEKINFLTEF